MHKHAGKLTIFWAVQAILGHYTSVLDNVLPLLSLQGLTLKWPENNQFAF